MPVPPLSWRTSVGGFWISPRKHPDFFWAFTSRLLLYLGNSVIAGFTLYLLIDYIGLGRDGAADFQPIMMLFATRSALSACSARVRCRTASGDARSS